MGMPTRTTSNYINKNRTTKSANAPTNTNGNTGHAYQGSLGGWNWGLGLSMLSF